MTQTSNSTTTVDRIVFTDFIRVALKKVVYLLIIALLPVLGCIEEYNPKGVNETSGILVIEGKITNGESVIYLRESVGLTEQLFGNETVDNALVYIEKDNGEQLPGLFRGKGAYVISTGELDAGTKYRLMVKYNGEEYVSEFLTPVITSEMDSLTYSKKGLGEPVVFHAYSHDNNSEGSRYYTWSFREIWEVKAELFADYGYMNGDYQHFSLATSENLYYCWARDSSKSILLGTSDKLSENVIYQKTITEIPCDNRRLSVLYYINVEQNQISKEAYDYFYNLKKNVEQTGSIFSPIPSEMKGNIRCTTNPAISVIGFIYASTTTTKELYVDGSYYEPKITLISEDGEFKIFDDCSGLVSGIREMGYSYYMYPALFAPNRCVNCTVAGNASKDRPDFWPNNHY